MEYTLKDAYDSLKQNVLQKEEILEDVAHVTLNNEPSALSDANTIEDLKEKRHKMLHSVLKEIEEEYPKDFPVPSTSDLHVTALRELQQEVDDAKELAKEMKRHLTDIENDIKYFEDKKNGLIKMKKACLVASETVANTTYEAEHVVIQRLYREVKKDMATVIKVMFPENIGLKQLLMELTLAHTSGGDDVYVTLKPGDLSYVNFLIEADIVVYHKFDKSKIKLTDLL